MTAKEHMEVEERGEGPYSVWSGLTSVLGNVISDQFPNEEGQREIIDDFLGALRMIFSLTNGGQELRRQYIRDANGVIVVSMNDLEDVKLVQQMDGVLLTVIPRSRD